MRLLLAGACSVLLLAGCGTTEAETSVAATPAGNSSGAAVTEPVTTSADPVATGGTTRCQNPAGFSVAYPADWSVNSGEVLPACSWFDAEAFVVPEASDIRTAAITFSVEPADGLGSPWPDETGRAPVQVGGRPALRVEQVAGPGFYPAGTPITSYVVDLGGQGEVLVAATVGLPGADHAANVAVLDALMASLVLDGAPRV